MNALASYLRHLIVTGLLILVEKLKLPIEGANAAADVIALAIVGTLSWWFVKYLAPKLKVPKGSGLALFALAASLALLAPSCGVSGNLNVPLPDRLGGGSLPITIQPEK